MGIILVYVLCSPPPVLPMAVIMFILVGFTNLFYSGIMLCVVFWIYTSLLQIQILQAGSLLQTLASLLHFSLILIYDAKALLKQPTHML